MSIWSIPSARVVNPTSGPMETRPLRSSAPKTRQGPATPATTRTSLPTLRPAGSACPTLGQPGSNIFDLLPQVLVWALARATHRVSCWYNDLFPGWSRWSSLDERVIIGALPRPEHIPPLVEEGVRGVVNMCEEFLGHPELYDTAEIVQCHLPTIDYCSPSLADIDAALKFMRERTEDGGKVYLHCKAGRGRSAVIALCWLIAEHDLTPRQAQRHLLKLRPQVLADLYLRPVVQAFARAHAARMQTPN